jgi:hypothetical protein
MSTNDIGNHWESLVKRILSDLSDLLGLTELEGDPETKIKLAGVSGTRWQCDLIALRAVRDKTTKRVKIECKWRGRNGVEQKEVAALAWSLNDINADGLIVAQKLQEGARKVADEALIGVLELTPGDTHDNYVAKLTNWFEHTVFAVGITETVSMDCTTEIIVKRADGTEEKFK